MRYLLDTCVLLWVLDDNKSKLAPFRDILAEVNNFAGVSVVTYWEIAIKRSLGKLKAPENIIGLVEESGYTWINLEPKHIARLSQLPLLHSDPFDRLLVAQANSEELQLLTNDKLIQQYFLVH